MSAMSDVHIQMDWDLSWQVLFELEIQQISKCYQIWKTSKFARMPWHGEKVYLNSLSANLLFYDRLTVKFLFSFTEWEGDWCNNILDEGILHEKWSS